jgi:hypothetical protein
VDITLIQTADHWVKEGDELDLAGTLYRVKEVTGTEPPEWILTYGLALIPAKVIGTLEKPE